MTRDEAMNKLVQSDGARSPDEAFLNAVVALGLLKLDEPLSPVQRAAQIMADYQRTNHDAGIFEDNFAEVVSLWKTAGLKIVEA